MIEYGYHLVAFIDILGQKESFKENGQYLDEIETYFDNPEELKKKFAKAHAETVVSIERLRKQFKDFFNAYTQKHSEPTLIPPDKINQFKKMREAEVDLQVFSDCILAISSLKKDEYFSHAINSVFGVLMACGGMLLASLSVGKPFRAGIEIGLGTKFEGVYGPVLFRAYELESSVAQYPRIVIGDGLLNFLYNLSDRHPQFEGQIKEDIEWCKLMADTCLKMIVKDVDGIYIFDYLGEEATKGVREQEGKDFMKRCYDDAKRFVEKEYKKHVDSKDEKLSKRYAMLNQYFNARKIE